MIHLAEQLDERDNRELWSDQLSSDDWNHSFYIRLNKNGTNDKGGEWSFARKNQMLTITINGVELSDIHVFRGHDWENQTETLLFTGLDSNGRTVWGKQVQ